MTNRYLRPTVLLAALALCVWPEARVRASGPVQLYTAADAIRRSICQRVAAAAGVTVVDLDLKNDAEAFREARPDPSAMLGKPIRFTLVTGNNAVVPVVANVVVTLPHAVARQAITRGQALGATEIETVQGPLAGIPLVRVPDAADVLGTRALRPMTSGTVVLSSFVQIRRAVEPGDAVTVVALAGVIEVTAHFVATDGGNVGDAIRVRNPESRTFVRGRIVKPGLVEVIYER